MGENEGSMLKSLNIVQIQVGDWESALQWYTEKLGLRAEAVHEHPFCLLAFPEGETVIGLDGTSPVEPGGRNRCIPTILVDDLEATVAELRARGVTVVGEIEGGDEGYRVISITDPEGNVIKLYEWAR
jgi:predicted enzyme related to lactoylglutathione lyase